MVGSTGSADVHSEASDMINQQIQEVRIILTAEQDFHQQRPKVDEDLLVKYKAQQQTGGS